jgi:hypothetical protein
VSSHYLLPVHRGGLRGLFVKVLGDEGSPHFLADDVPGGGESSHKFNTVITATNLIRVVSVVSS